MLGSREGRETDGAAGVADAIDALLARDPDTLDDHELADLTVALHRQQSRLASATTRVTAAVDARGVWGEDGSRSCGAWLARRCRLPHAQARGEVRLGRRLSTMPQTRAAFGAGDITARHAAVLGSLNTGRTAELFARDEALLVDDARCLSWPEFCVAIDYWRQHADPDGVERDAAGDEAARRVHLSPGLRGSGILDGLLTPLGRATVATALGRIEQDLFAADWAQARAQHGDQACVAHIARTPAQRRHDALVELAHRALAAPPDRRRPEPVVSVLVGYETFRGRVCQLADGTVITPGTVASLLGEAWIERVVFDGPSRVVDLGQARRFVGAARRALEIRDRHCTHPGCDEPPERCQGDHIQPWSTGGPTTPDNGQLRCGYHNRWRWQHPEPDRPEPPPRDPLEPPPGPDPGPGANAGLDWLEAWRANLRATMLAEQDD